MIQNIHSLAEQFEDKDTWFCHKFKYFESIAQSKPSFSNEVKSKILRCIRGLDMSAEDTWNKLHEKERTTFR